LKSCSASCPTPREDFARWSVSSNQRNQFDRRGRTFIERAGYADHVRTNTADEVTGFSEQLTFPEENGGDAVLPEGLKKHKEAQAMNLARSARTNDAQSRLSVVFFESGA